MFKPIILVVVLVLMNNVTEAGPLAYAACQAAVAGVAAACFAAAGFTFGTVPGAVIASTPALAACNSALAAGYTTCSGLLLAPTP